MSPSHNPSRLATLNIPSRMPPDDVWTLPQDQARKDLYGVDVVLTRCPETGNPVVIDEGHELRGFNVQAKSTARSSSAESSTSSSGKSSVMRSYGSSSASTTPELASSGSSEEEIIPALKIKTGVAIRHPRPVYPIPTFYERDPTPPPDPAEERYKYYRDQLRNATNIAAPICELLVSGLGHVTAKVVAPLLARLSVGKPNVVAVIRSEAIKLFRAYWDTDAWRKEPHGEHDYLTSRGVNIAGLLGSLFANELFPTDDVLRAIGVLTAGNPAFLKLMALHALVVHAGPPVCVGDARLRIEGLLAVVFARDSAGALVWGQHEESAVLVQHLMQVFEAYLASDDMRQIHEKAVAYTAPSATMRYRIEESHE
ncbi:hypothetical protein MIND_00922400 [Mycena indigotica]|uniref:Uncharacterized protein n=1 Tax=Mycena indigotica TaxID=2126181 RepID=A0A8H6SDU1_9AGAR|nr:uncharacterized protein MIND_00922400 [Mycena indigotica]KAF7296906.1 hypothetical protein MIND_00922400 [Mycena indigotica]